jgi:hypothetical protein
LTSQHVDRIFRIDRKDRAADADRHAQIARANAKRFVAHRAELGGQLFGFCRRIDLRLQHDELIATDAADRIAIA